MTRRSLSAADTKKLAAGLARRVLRRGPGRKAIVIALRGELGGGKTTFVQGFLRGLGLKRVSPSPTFILWRRFNLRRRDFRCVFHVDAYRIKKAGELFALGLGDILSKPEHIVLLEWPERLGRRLPQNAIRIEFLHGAKDNQRIITLRNTKKYEYTKRTGNANSYIRK